MKAPTIHCPNCKQILVKDVTFLGVFDLQMAKVDFTIRCAHCKDTVKVELQPGVTATGNGERISVGEKTEPRVRTFHS